MNNPEAIPGKEPGEDYKDYLKGTLTDRGLQEYEVILGFKEEELEGKTVLDLGSGATEKFARDLE